MRYLFSKCYPERGQFDIETGALVIPEWAVERWQRQMKTNYENLSESEKDSDRREADKLFYLLNKKINKGELKMVTKIVDISSEVEGEDMPVCPLCDNEIEEGDGKCLVKSEGSVALAHLFCAEEFASEELEFASEEPDFNGKGLA